MSYNPKRQRRSLSVNCFELLMLLEIEVLRYLLVFFGATVRFTTGFRRRSSVFAFRPSVEVKLSSFFFEDELELRVLDAILDLFHLPVGQASKHRSRNMLMNEVVSNLGRGRPLLQILQFLCGMTVVRPFLCIKEDIFSSHFFHCIKIY